MAITAGAAAVSGLWTTYILRKMVPMLQDELLFARFAKPATLPKNSGYVARWLLPQKFSGSTSALSDGSATDGEKTTVTISKVEATITQYGEWMKVSDLAEETEISSALDTYSEMFAFAGADAIDSLIRNAAVTTTNFLHAGDAATAGATLTSSDKLTLDDFPTITGFFRANNAKGFSELSGDFALLIHPTDEVNLVSDVTTTRLSWSEANKHVPKGFEQLVNNHTFVGRFNGLTALRTTKITTVTEDVSAYRNVALADYGVGWLGLGQDGPKKPMIKIKRPGPSDTSQPLDMYMTIGWKVNMVARLLDSNRVLNVYSAA